MADIFISYARVDRDKIKPIVERLEDEGYEVWYDASLEAGEAFSDEIMRELDAARCVIVVWSEASAKSTWAYSEADIARERNILIPVRIDDCRLPPPFNAIETVDLRTWRGRPEDVQWDRVSAKVHDLCRGGRMVRRRIALEQARELRIAHYVIAGAILLALGFGIANWRAIFDWSGAAVRQVAAVFTPRPDPALDTRWRDGWQRGFVSVTGSSSVAPFARAVARTFAPDGDPDIHIVPAGTNNGMGLFCSGLGDHTPDILLASRRQTRAEFDRCKDAGVTRIAEAKIGYGAVVLVQAADGTVGPLSFQQVFQAFAARVPTGTNESGTCVFERNPYTRWSQIDPSLPDLPILVFGPAESSGTRDVFVELAMEPGAAAFDCIQTMANEPGGADTVRALAASIRTDNTIWRNASEYDDITATQVAITPGALGIFGFATFAEDTNGLKALPIDGIAPAKNTIASGRYPLSRALYFYVKADHAGLLPAIGAYARAFVSEAAIGPDGHLADAENLIPLPSSVDRRAVRRDIDALTPYRQ